jgi:hypothetical protein
MTEKHGDIQLGEDMAFQRREWALQRVGWALMGLVVVAAILGFTGGPGALNSAKWEGDGIRVEGRRVERHHRPTEMLVHIGKSGRVEFWIEGDFLQRMKVEQVVPEPVEMRRAGERLVMVLEMGSGGDVKLHIEPDGMGRSRARMGVVGGGEVSVTQWLLP